MSECYPCSPLPSTEKRVASPFRQPGLWQFLAVWPLTCRHSLRNFTLPEKSNLGHYWAGWDGRRMQLAERMNERIRIRLEGYDYEILDKTVREIVDTAERTGAVVHGPIPLPTRIERYTVLRSPHIDRKSREQFEIRTHKRLVDILQPTGKTIEALNKGLSLPPGVDIKIRVMSAAT